MKKLIALIMALMLIIGCFASCGTGGSEYKENADDSVTLSIAIPESQQRDALKVTEEINKKLATLLPNTTVSMVFDADMADKWTLWMSTKKNLDIAHSGFATSIEDEVRKESYIELNELVDEHAPNIKKLQEEYWYSYDNASINGKLYAIPNTQYFTKETLVLCLWKEAVGFVDTTALTAEAYANPITSRKFYEILTAGLEKAEKNGVDMTASMESVTMYSLAKRGYAFIGGEGSNICYDVNSDEGKLLNFYDTDAFKLYCEFTKLWADKGWISDDILTGAWTDKITTRNIYRYGLNKETREIAQLDDGTTYKMFDLNDPEKDVLVTNIGQNSTYWSIPFTSENPVRAIKFLDLINSEEGKDILNLMAYGIEGTHYEFTDKENGDIKAFEYVGQGGASVSYGVPNWMVANMMLIYNVAPYTHDFQEYGKDYYLNRLSTLKKHPLYKFSFDIEPVRSELTKVLKINNEYAKTIYCGIVEKTDLLYKEMIEKNNAAGFDKIMTEFQKQADEYIKSGK